MSDESEYKAGVRDCANGTPHQPGRSEWYDMGYSAQYALEQVASA